MSQMSGADPFAELKTSSEEYAVYDSHYERIGKVDDVVLDELDRVAYVGVKMGFFGMDSTLVPVELVRVNDKRRLVEVAESKEMIRHAPRFGQDETVTPELEDRVRTYFGLEPLHSSHVQEDSYTSSPPDESRFGADERVDVEPGERARAQEERPLPGSVEGEGSREIASRPAGQEEGVVKDRLSDEPEDRWQRQPTEGGVRVHRRTR
jgi:PRC-barrel domain